LNFGGELESLLSSFWFVDAATRTATTQARDATERRSLQDLRVMLALASLSLSLSIASLVFTQFFLLVRFCSCSCSFLLQMLLLPLLLEIVTKHIPGQTQLCNTYIQHIYIHTYVCTLYKRSNELLRSSATPS